MKTLYQFLVMLFVAFVFCPVHGDAQFRNTYLHNFSDDHTALIKKHDGLGYVQVSTSQHATKDIHLMKIDLNGNVMLDETFHSPSSDDVALDICLGNNDTYIICGYEHVGSLDLGFVMSVDTSFNFLNKTYINTLTNSKHTPALRVINSAYYEKTSPNTYWPGDPAQGYLVVGFEADGYGTTQSKSGYAVKITNALTFSWARKFSSPITPGTTDWDMCSNANWMWTGAFGYVIGGSGTSPSGEQTAFAARLNLNGTVVWSQLYSDNNVAGTWCVAADGAYDDAEAEFYQLVNYSQTQSGGIVALDQNTGAINMARTRYLISPFNDYYTYEFGSTCASQDIFISGYGHNQTSGGTQGLFPFVIKYNKNFPQVDIWGPHYAYPTQSINYNPSGSIFSTFSTPEQPRIYYPKHWASRSVNIWSVAGFEDNGVFNENKIIHPQFDGKDSCGYIDPMINAVPQNMFTFPVNNTSVVYTLTAGVNTQNSESQTVTSCCPVNANFTYTNNNPNCTYTFTATSPSGFCSGFVIKDMSNVVIASGLGGTFSYTFTMNGTYNVCFNDCAPLGGSFCRAETCQTINVTCAVPCGPIDADFNISVTGCTVNVNDLTPDGNIYGCESWTFGSLPTVYTGDVASITFPGSGTYTICHTDCCMDAVGTPYYHTVCKSVTVNCTPPCCLPTGWTMTGSSCCRTFNPIYPNTLCANANFYWNFGDGNTSWSSNPTHCYAGGGIYTVTMIAWCSGGLAIMITKTIKIKLCAIVIGPSCCTGTSKMTFAASGTLLTTQDVSSTLPDATVSQSEWNWGDGTTSNGAQVSHYYQIPGTYDVTLTTSFISSTGSVTTDSVTETITVNRTPICTCNPDHVIAFAGAPLSCTSDGHSTSLHIVDYEGEANMTYQWMKSSSADGSFVEMPGVRGLQVWVENINEPTYFKCRCTCNTTGATFFTQVIAVMEDPIAATADASPSNICVGGSSNVVVNATGAVSHEWDPNASNSSSAIVSPTITTLYSVLVQNASGCGALAEASVTVDNCVVPMNDSPNTATSISYSSNMAFPNCYPILGNLSYATDSPESAEFTGTDGWYKFVAQSSAVSITMSSTTMDDAIALYQKVGTAYVLMPNGSENSASGIADFERLNYQGLIPGTTYFVSIGASAGAGGAFTLCIQHLLPSGCAYAVPANGFSLCGNYKAIFRGALSSGVSYAFNFTGIGGGAPNVTTSLSGTNGLINLSNPILGLRFGGIYQASVDVQYALLNGNGVSENIVVAGSVNSANCQNVTIAAQPLIEVRQNQRCPAVLLRSNYLIGSPVTGSSNACSAISYTYEFTQVVSCDDATSQSLVSTYITSSATPYLPLGVLTSLPNQGAWRVRIAPNFSYGIGAYGPSHLIRVNNTAGSIMLVDEFLEESEKSEKGELFSAEIFPNPNKGDAVHIQLSNLESGSVIIQLLDELGRVVHESSYSTEGTIFTTLHLDQQLSDGVYTFRFIMRNEIQIRRLVIQKS
jgi:PKD repeat protein